MHDKVWVRDDTNPVNKEGDLIQCDLQTTLAHFATFDRCDRTHCPTKEQWRSDDPGECQLLFFELYPGDNKEGDQEHAKCFLDVMAYKPSGYEMTLRVPRYLFHRIPTPMVRQYSDKEKSIVTFENVKSTINALFSLPEKDLEAWAEQQPFLTKTH